MRDNPTKADGVGDTLPADTFNSIQDELENLAESDGFTLDPEIGPDTDLEMMAKSFADYAVTSWSFIDSGSVNAYAVNNPGGFKKIAQYYNRMVVVFKATNTNTGASTINVQSIGIKDFTLNGGDDLYAGAVIEDKIIIATYNSSNDRFEIANPNIFSTEAEDIAKIATDKIISPRSLSDLARTGSIVGFVGDTISDAYLLCDGSEVSRTTYANLYAAIGDKYGDGDGSTTFNLPSRSTEITGQINQEPAIENYFVVSVNFTTDDVYIGSLTEQNVYKQTGGYGSWVDQSAPAEGWRGMDINSTTNDVFIGGSSTLYKQVGGTGSWIDQLAPSYSWTGISVNEVTGDVYICTTSGLVYKQTGGTGSWIDQSAPAGNFSGIAVNETTGDVYLCGTTFDDIFKQTGGVGSWDAQVAPAVNWSDIKIDQDTGNVYAVAVDVIYIQEGGTGDFVTWIEIFTQAIAIEVVSNIDLYYISSIYDTLFKTSIINYVIKI